MSLNPYLTCITGLTGAVVVVDQIYAGGSVLTLPDAVVDVDVTVSPGPTLLALAAVVAHRVLAGVRVDAWLRFTLVYVCTGGRKKSVSIESFFC